MKTTLYKKWRQPQPKIEEDLPKKKEDDLTQKNEDDLTQKKGDLTQKLRRPHQKNKMTSLNPGCHGVGAIIFKKEKKLQFFVIFSLKMHCDKYIVTDDIWQMKCDEWNVTNVFLLVWIVQ